MTRVTSFGVFPLLLAVFHTDWRLIVEFSCHLTFIYNLATLYRMSFQAYVKAKTWHELLLSVLGGGGGSARARAATIQEHIFPADGRAFEGLRHSVSQYSSPEERL